MHPSQEHELVLASAHRRVLDAHGNAVGQVPRILPGSLEEREACARIDEARQEAVRGDRGDADATRRLRRYWASRGRHEA